MSERLEFNPEEMPRIKLNMPSGEFEATPLNTTLFTFLGRLACYDHIFLQTGDETDEAMVGTYIFNQHSVYDEMAAFLVENNYPMLLNRIETPDCDIDAFNRMVSQSASDLDSGIPDEWLGDETSN